MTIPYRIANKMFPKKLIFIIHTYSYIFCLIQSEKRKKARISLENADNVCICAGAKKLGDKFFHIHHALIKNVFLFWSMKSNNCKKNID